VGLGGGVRLENGYVIVATKDLEARFSRGAPVSTSYMVFGGLNDRHPNALQDAHLATLEMRHAQLIHATYPDFHRCSSPGAAQAKRYVEDFSVIGAGGSEARALRRVVDLHGERVASGGERTCVSLEGAELQLESVVLRADGRDVTQEVAGAFQSTRFVLADQVKIPDCQSLLR
jgi:hypothetical protein